jgi:hypothetical protein
LIRRKACPRPCIKDASTAAWAIRLPSGFGDRRRPDLEKRGAMCKDGNCEAVLAGGIEPEQGANSGRCGFEARVARIR